MTQEPSLGRRRRRRDGAVKRLLPGFTRLRGYRRPWLRGDLLAGLTVAAYLVPQVMAYATVAGLPPVAGLWAILAPLAIYALFGSSRQLSVGPESTTALMTATVVAPLAAGDPARYASLAAALAVIVGLLCLLAFAARLGFVADLLSKPILVGYLAGVAVIMIVGQLGKLTGVPVTGDSSGRRADLLRQPVVRSPRGHAAVRHRSAGVLVRLGSGAFPACPRRWSPSCWPPWRSSRSTCRAMASRSWAPFRGLPTPALPGLGDLPHLLLPAIGVLIVGYTDTVLTARAFAAGGDSGRRQPGTAGPRYGEPRRRPAARLPGQQQRQPDRPRRGRRRRTQVYSLVALACVVGGPALPRARAGHFSRPPHSARSWCTPPVRLIDIAGFRRLASFRRSELLLALAALDGRPCLRHPLRRAAGGRAVRGRNAATASPAPTTRSRAWSPAWPACTTLTTTPRRRRSPDSSSTATTRRCSSPTPRTSAAAPSPQWPTNPFLSPGSSSTSRPTSRSTSPALEALEGLRAELARRGVVFALARVKRDLLDDLDAFGLTTSIGDDRIFPTLPTAVAAYQEWRRQHPHTR